MVNGVRMPVSKFGRAVVPVSNHRNVLKWSNGGCFSQFSLEEHYVSITGASVNVHAVEALTGTGQKGKFSVSGDKDVAMLCGMSTQVLGEELAVKGCYTLSETKI